MLEITQREHEYIIELADSPKTSQELAVIMGINDANVSKRISTLRAMGVLRSDWVTRDQRRLCVHSLTQSYDDLVSSGLAIRYYNRTPITEEEIYYAAILTRAGLTGLNRVAQYQKLFPERTRASLKGILMKARRRHLCR